MTKPKPKTQVRKMYILLATWTEPSDDEATQTVSLTKKEADKVYEVINWLDKNGGDCIGHTLCDWTLTPCKGTGKGDLNGLDEVLNDIVLNSRYFETDTPGEYYGGARNAELDARRDAY